PLAVLGGIASHEEGCNHTVSDQTKLTPADARQYVKDGDPYVKAFVGKTEVNVKQALGLAAESASAAALPQAQYTLTGKIALRPSARASKRFGEFLNAHITGTLGGSFISGTTEDARGTMTVRAAF